MYRLLIAGICISTLVSVSLLYLSTCSRVPVLVLLFCCVVCCVSWSWYLVSVSFSRDVDVSCLLCVCVECGRMCHEFRDVRCLSLVVAWRVPCVVMSHGATETVVVRQSDFQSPAPARSTPAHSTQHLVSSFFLSTSLLRIFRLLTEYRGPRNLVSKVSI